MTRPLIAALMAAVLALTAITPAMAQQSQQQTNENIAKLLAGAAGIYIIGKAISNKRERDREEAASRDALDDFRVLSDRDERRLSRDRWRQDERFTDRHHNCWREKWRGGKLVRYRDGRCMKKWKKRARHRAEKPRVCLRKRWTPDGWETFYSRRCLRQHGWDGRRTRFND